MIRSPQIVYGMTPDQVIDALESLHFSTRQLKLAEMLCYKLRSGEIRLKDINKMSETRNSSLLRKLWIANYRFESSDPLLAIRRFQLTTEWFSKKREEKALSLVKEIGEICNIDIVGFVNGSVKDRRADFKSDVDLRCIVQNSHDVPKIRLLSILASFLNGEIICASFMANGGVICYDELFTQKTYSDPLILLFALDAVPHQSTSNKFLELTKKAIQSGVRKWIPSIRRNLMFHFRTYGINLKRTLLDTQIDFQFRQFLKLLDLGMKYTLTKRLDFDHQTFWQRLRLVPSSIEDYEDLEIVLGKALINAKGDPEGHILNNSRRELNRVIKKYCAFE